MRPLCVVAVTLTLLSAAVAQSLRIDEHASTIALAGGPHLEFYIGVPHFSRTLREVGPVKTARLFMKRGASG